MSFIAQLLNNSLNIKSFLFFSFLTFYSGLTQSAEPTVVNEQFQISMNGELRVTSAELLANDRGQNGTGQLTVEFLDDWVNGFVSYDRSRDVISFTPDNNFAGEAQFTYTVFDGLERGWGFVRITVIADTPEDNPPVIEEPPSVPEVNPVEPIVVGETFYTRANESIVISVNEVLENDEGLNGTGYLGIDFIDDWVNGSATFNRETEEIMFTPETDFTGSAQFTYIVYDGLARGWGIASIVVEANSDDLVDDSNDATDDPVSNPPLPPSDPDIANNTVRQFTFNHSLWDHASSLHTNTVTGYWVGEFANVSATSYAWNGQFGQLNYHSLPPSPQLGSINSADLFPSESTDFRDVELDSIVIMPPNFVQGSSENVASQEFSAAQRVIDYLIDDSESGANKRDASIYIYEHWPEAVSENLTAAQWRDYHNLTTGTYHQWFLNYQNELQNRYPTIDFRMVPVGPIIAEILQNSELSASSLSFTELYEDNSPHGTPNLYFLAGLVSYQAFFGQRVDEAYLPPIDTYSGVSPLIANDFAALNDFVWQRLQHYNNNGVRIWP